MISHIKTSRVEIREQRKETTLEIEVENPIIELSPSTSSLDPKIPPK